STSNNNVVVHWLSLLRQREHPLERNFSPLFDFCFDLDPIYHLTFNQVVEYPREICRMNTVHGRAWAHDRIQTKDQLVGILRCETMHHADFRPNRPLRT